MCRAYGNTQRRKDQRLAKIVGFWGPSCIDRLGLADFSDYTLGFVAKVAGQANIDEADQLLWQIARQRLRRNRTRGASYRLITAGDWSNAVTALASPREVGELRQAAELTDAERQDYGLPGPLTIFGQPTNPGALVALSAANRRRHRAQARGSTGGENAGSSAKRARVEDYRSARAVAATICSLVVLMPK